MLKIKDKISTKNCSITNVDTFVQRIKERDSIVGYELLIVWYKNSELQNKILIKINDINNVAVDVQKEFKYQHMDNILKSIQSLTESKYNYLFTINNVERINNVVDEKEYVYFGILNKYLFDYIEYKTSNLLTNEQIDNNIRKIINNYNSNIEEINKKIFFEMYNQLNATDYPIWEYDSFKKIFNVSLLPRNFFDLSNDDKLKVLYLDGDYNYIELWEKISLEKPFWRLDKIKEDIKISNVLIDEEFKHLIFEFNGFCKFFVAYLELNYEDEFNVNVFNPS